MEHNAKAKTKYLRNKKKLLEEFGIVVTEDISARLDELYPNEVATENYTRKIILKSYRR